ncbi:MAG: hypothetical protein KJ906_02675 [Nanoarchaeota archaeon]|nr:hypothetical protein [Nanoarchaeota archaeon]
MVELSVLYKNLKEYLSYAREAYNKENYNTAVTLFFKALVTICDIEIFKRTKILPSSHDNRFRTLEARFPYLYRIVDRDFPYYTDSYRITISKRVVDLVKKDVEKLLKEFGMDEKIK